MHSLKKITRGRATRAAILEAAASLFAENGYAETGVAQICRRAGISRGALYYHFESKEALFMELVDSQLTGLKKALERSIGGAVDLPTTLRRLSHLVQELTRPGYAKANIFLEVWAQASREQTVREALLNSSRHFEELLTQLIRRGIDEGTFAPINPAAGAKALLATAGGAVMHSLIGPEDSGWAGATEESINIMINGLKRRPSE